MRNEAQEKLDFLYGHCKLGLGDYFPVDICVNLNDLSLFLFASGEVVSVHWYFSESKINVLFYGVVELWSGRLNNCLVQGTSK